MDEEDLSELREAQLTKGFQAQSDGFGTEAEFSRKATAQDQEEEYVEGHSICLNIDRLSLHPSAQWLDKYKRL
jgi:hypothetical protein